MTDFSLYFINDHVLLMYFTKGFHSQFPSSCHYLLCMYLCKGRGDAMGGIVFIVLLVWSILCFFAVGKVLCIMNIIEFIRLIDGWMDWLNIISLTNVEITACELYYMAFHFRVHSVLQEIAFQDVNSSISVAEMKWNIWPYKRLYLQISLLGPGYFCNIFIWWRGK